jgi:hypothetical protein
VISRTWLEHERIATPDDEGGCEDKPTRSKVAVRVESPDGPLEVTLFLRSGDRTVTLPLTRAGDSPVWYGVIGPFERDQVGHGVEVTVRAVAADGSRADRRVGIVCVTSCRRDRGAETRQ